MTHITHAWNAEPGPDDAAPAGRLRSVFARTRAGAALPQWFALKGTVPPIFRRIGAAA